MKFHIGFADGMNNIIANVGDFSEIFFGVGEIPVSVVGDTELDHQRRSGLTVIGELKGQSIIFGFKLGHDVL